MKSTRSGGLMQLAATLSMSVLMLNTGMSTVWSSPMIPKLVSKDSPIGVQLTMDQANWVVAFLPIGNVFGYIVLSLCFNYFGRKGSLLIFSVPNCVSWFIIMFANSAEMLYVGRFLLGFCVAIPTGISIPYVGEIVDADNRGVLAILGLLITEVGQVLQIVVGTYCSYKTGPIIGALSPVVLFISMYFMPESPYYYVVKGKLALAEKSLQVYRGRENVSEELKSLQDNVQENMKNNSGIREWLQNKSYRKPMLIVLGCMTLTQVSGGVAIQNYMKYIFDIADTGLNSDVSSIICALVSLPALLVAGYLIDRLGRKPLYYISITGCGIGILLETVYFFMKDSSTAEMSSIKYLPLAGIFLYYIFKVFGITSFALLYLGELFAPNVKGVASTVCLVYGSILASMVSYGFGPFSATFGIATSFLVFNIIIVVGFVFALLCVPETKGKTLLEIQDELDRKNHTLE